MSERPSVSEYVAASRAAQGLPPKVADRATLQRVASLIRPAPQDQRAAS